MDKPDVRDMVSKRRDSCVKFRDGKPRKDRKDALDFYNGVNLTAYGDSGDGMSTVVSRDVMEAIESVMPPLLEPFLAGDEVVGFDPVEETDKDAVEQATTYINHVFRRHNNVLHVAQSGLKDSLLFRMGVAKTVMEEEEEGEAEEYAGLDEAQLEAAKGMGRDIAGDIAQDPATGLYTVKMAPKKVKRFRVNIIAPSEFLYEERLASLEAATFLGHSRKVTVGEVIEMGISAEKAKALHSGSPTEEQDALFRDEDGYTENDWQHDDPARPVQIDECYIKCDCGSGVSEWRKVVLGGSQSTLLSDEAADGHPYSVWTPIPMPHKLVGLSFFDITKDIQMQKTALIREQLNNLYLVNRPQREVVDGQVNMDDLLNPTVNGIVRVKQIGMITPLLTPFVAEKTFGMVEYLDAQREARTGVTRYNQGMDSNSLNKTATGINIISSNSQQRQKLVARQFGEFLKDIFERLLALVAAHADPEDVSRLTGKPFVPWPTTWDTNVSVGLGNNNKDQLVGHIMALLQLDQSIVALQGGVQGPLLTAENIYAKLKLLPNAMGIKDSTFYTDPSDAQQQQPEEEQPDPMAEMQMKAETEIGKAQIKADTDLKVAEIKHSMEAPQLVGGDRFAA